MPTQSALPSLTAVTTSGDAATGDSLSGVVLAGLAPELVQIFADVAQSTTDMKRVAVALAAASDLGITVARARSVNLIGSNRLAVGTTRSVVLASLAPELARAAADTRTVATPLSATKCPALFLPAVHLSLCNRACPDCRRRRRETTPLLGVSSVVLAGLHLSLSLPRSLPTLSALPPLSPQTVRASQWVQHEVRLDWQ